MPWILNVACRLLIILWKLIILLCSQKRNLYVPQRYEQKNSNYFPWTHSRASLFNSHIDKIRLSTLHTHPLHTVHLNRHNAKDTVLFQWYIWSHWVHHLSPPKHLNLWEFTDFLAMSFRLWWQSWFFMSFMAFGFESPVNPLKDSAKARHLCGWNVVFLSSLAKAPYFSHGVTHVCVLQAF